MPDKDKELAKIKRREYYERNKETIGIKQAAYRASNEVKERQRLYHAEYRLKNKERIAETNREYAIANRERIAETNRAYAIANREKIKERKAKYKKDNREKVNAYNSKYRESNRELCRSWDRKSKVKLKGKYQLIDKCRRVEVRKTLADTYIKMLLTAHDSGVSRKSIPPEMIEAKRVHLKLKRLIKEITK